MIEEIKFVINTLKKIEAWDLPVVWNDKLQKYFPYEVELGSNGARDYFRDLARKALLKINE